MWDWSELTADGKDEKSEGGDDQSETDDESESLVDHSQMTDAEESNDDEKEQTGGGRGQTEMDLAMMIVVIIKVNLITEIQNVLNMVYQKCRIGVSLKLRVKMKNLTDEMTYQKQIMNLKMVMIIMKMREMKKVKRVNLKVGWINLK